MDIPRKKLPVKCRVIIDTREKIKHALFQESEKGDKYVAAYIREKIDAGGYTVQEIPNLVVVEKKKSDGKELYNNVMFDGLRTLGFYTNARLSSKFFAEIQYNSAVGFARFELVKDREKSVYASINYKPIDRLTIQPSINYVKADQFDDGKELFKGYITRTRIRFQAAKELSTRLVVQYNDFNKSWDIDPLVTYRISPFSVFYVGSSYNYGEVENTITQETLYKVKQRQFFVKLQYLFQT